MTVLDETAVRKLQALIDHMDREPMFHFSILKKFDGEYSIGYEFGREADDSPMYGGASYGIGGSLDEAIADIYKDLRIEG